MNGRLIARADALAGVRMRASTDGAQRTSSFKRYSRLMIQAARDGRAGEGDVAAHAAHIRDQQDGWNEGLYEHTCYDALVRSNPAPNSKYPSLTSFHSLSTMLLAFIRDRAVSKDEIDRHLKLVNA